MRRLAVVASAALGCLLVWTPAVSGASALTSRHSVSGSPAGKASLHGKKRHSRRAPVQKAPTPERIAEIQSALARAGYYPSDPSGRWDSNTVTAMQKFQSSNGLDATGKIDALSLQKLGLGSSIAGVSQPKPVVPQTSNPAPSSAPPLASAGSPGPASSSLLPGGSAVAPSSATGGATADEALVQK